DLASGFALQPGSSVGGAGTVRFDTGQSAVAGSYAVSGATIVASGSARFSGSVSNVGSSLTVSGGLADFSTGQAGGVSMPALTVSGGTLSGSDELTVNGLLTWSGGTQSGSGSTSAQGGMALSGGTILDGRTLNTSQQVIWSGQNSRFDANNGAVINNAGTWDSQADQFLFTAGAAAAFHNSGVLQKSGGLGITYIDTALSGAGSVQALNGTLMLRGGGSATGSFVAGSGAVLDLASGFALQPGSSVSGAGTVRFDTGQSAVAGSYAVSGATIVASGSARFSGSVSNVGSSLTVSGGLADFSTGQAGGVSMPALTVSGGTLSGSDELTVNGLLTWSG